jgi:hypothetical protein
MILIKATKNLVHGDGTLSFIKGDTYECPFASVLTEHTQAYNDQNQIHRLGMWVKHFTIIQY